MNCDHTYSETILDLTKVGQPRAVHAATLKFIRGLRRRRQNPVTKRQIQKWLRRTPPAAIDDALADLIFEGKVAACRNWLRDGRNNSARGHVYEATEAGLPPGWR